MTIQQRWQQAEDYMEDIPKFTKKNTLANTRKWYKRLGMPGQQAGIIHVAGTNGKGSVCNYLSHMLLADGRKVGMFVSPHLISMNERIVVCGKIIDRKVFLEAYDVLRSAIDEELAKEQSPKALRQAPLLHPTFFEFLFLLAMLVFEKMQVELIVLETGLGGRLDATNIFDRPLMTIITEIGLDHMQYLGETKSQIAEEKAGIIKREVPLVFADHSEETTRVLAARARQLEAPCEQISPKDHIIQNLGNKSIDFSYKSKYYDYIKITLPTSAVYQAENAALALRAYEVLMGDAWDTHRIRAVLAKTRWAGRMEEIMPDVYVDGAHNEDGIQAFLDSVCQMPGSHKILVFSVVKDKAFGKMVHMLAVSGLFERFVAVHMPQERSVSTEELRQLFSVYKTIKVSFADTIEEALAQSVGAKQSGETVYIAGSLYLVGYVKAALGRMSKDDQL